MTDYTTMTNDKLTDAELDELHRHGGSKRGNELTDRAIAELKKLRAEVAAADEVIEQTQRVSESWRLAGPITGNRVRKLVMRLPVPNTEDYVYLELEENCGPCGGTGGPERSCGLCGGTGIVANREGLILISLVRRYGGGFNHA